MNLKAILIVGALSALSGAAKAVKDTISHHHGMSVFATWNAQYWNPQESWKNKYKNYDQGDKRPRYLLATTWLVWTTDAWHFMDTLYRMFLIGAGVVGGMYANRSAKGWKYWSHAYIWFLYIVISGAASFHFLYTYVFV